MDNSKYYFIKRKGDQAYPIINILNLGSVESGDSPWIMAEPSRRLTKQSVMADFLKSGEDILSNRIAEVMKTMDMEGVCFYPVLIGDVPMEHYNNYTCVVVDDNTYELMDKELSDYIFRHRTYSFSKLVIDRKKLNDIPLNKRLGMRLREAPGYALYHQSVVDAVMALEPTGMYFQDIEDYEIL